MKKKEKVALLIKQLCSMARHKQQNYLIHFYNTSSFFFDTLYFCKTIFYFMILVNVLKYFMSWYLFTFLNTCFILDISYSFEILHVTFRFFVTFLKYLVSFGYFVIFFKPSYFVENFILLGALWLLKHANFLRLVFLYFPRFRNEATILRSKNWGLLFKYRSLTQS